MFATPRHKKIFFFLLFLFLCIAGVIFFAFSTDSAVAISRVEVNGERFVVGESLSGTAYFSDWEQIASVDVFIDGVAVLSCAGAPSCAMSYALLPEDIGEHEYVFVVTDKKGKKISSGGVYSVVTDAPEMKKLKTNNSVFSVGGALHVQTDATSESPIDSAKVYVDGELKQYCVTMPCDAYIGPFTADDAGEHTYAVVITNKKGKTITPGGAFTVLLPDATETKPVSVPELLNFQISNANAPVGGTAQVSVVAKDEKGIASITVFYDKKNVGGCNDTPQCSVTLGPFSDADAGLHDVLVVIINKDGKKIEVSGGVSVKKNAAAPEAGTEKSSQQASAPNQNGSSEAPGNSGQAAAQPQTGGSGESAKPVTQPTPVQGQTPVASSTPKAVVPAPQPLKDVTQGEASAPQLVYMASLGNQLFVGDTASVSILVKDEKGIDTITAYVDGKIVATCKNLLVCSFKKGPLTEKDIGTHTYVFVVKNISGKIIEPGGTFSVQKPSGATTPSGVVPTFDDAIAGTDINAESLVQPTLDMSAILPVPDIKKSPLWIDTDGGIKEYVVGQCVSNVQGAPYQKSIQDYCVDKKQLVEFYLDSAADKCLSKQLTCDGVCYGGQCYESGTRPGAGYTPSQEPPSRPGAGYTPPSRPGAGYTPPTTSISSRATNEAPPSRPGAGYTPPLWIDTDGGIKEYVVGQCVSNVQGAPYQKSIQDYCVDKKQLVEFYLDNAADKCLSKQLTCDGVCYGGQCYESGTRPGAVYAAPTTTPSRPTYEAPPSVPSRPTYESSAYDIPTRPIYEAAPAYVPSRPTYEAPSSVTTTRPTYEPDPEPVSTRTTTEPTR